MQLFASHAVSAPSVHITYPPASLFKFPPKSLPSVLAPPVSDYTFARPFNISSEVYNDLLSINLPISIGLLYVTIVIVVSRLNAERKHKPWAISQTRAFYAFVVFHNVFLAFFSAWTFFGMLNAITQSWPGLVTEGSITEVVDALCKINGPRGLGNAATYNSLTGSWGVTNQAIKLLGGEPDNTDVGRIWNEGLAFYGWLFYLSKFYETVDTMIILAKGKKSSVLQTYHHTGAMLCMWAGIRYMAPPIWMFVLINSGVHALMYTYYAATALKFRVAPAIKRSIAALQIAQFVIGATYAFAHLFIAYNLPVNTPYLYMRNISRALPSVTASVSSSVASATLDAGVGPWLKKIALRAAGEEGLAENVHNYQGQRFGLDAVHNENVERFQEEIRYRLEYPRVHCVDTSGQVFAILLNVLYLAPLIYLFAIFFIRSYIGRTSSTASHQTHSHTFQKSGHDALKGVEREIHEAMGNDLSDMSPEIMRGSVSDVKAYASDKYDGVKARASEGYENAKPKVEEIRVKLGESYENIKSQAVPKVEEAKDWMGESYQNIKAEAAPYAEDVTEKVKAESKVWYNWFGKKSKETGNATAQKVKEGSEVAVPKAKEAANALVEKANDTSDVAAQRTKELRDQAAPKIKEGANAAAETTKSFTDAAGAKAQGVKDQAESKLKDGAAKAKSTAGAATEKANKSAQDAADKAGPKLNEAKDQAGKKAQDVANTTSAKSNDVADKAPKKTKEVADKGRDKVHEAADKGNEKVKEGTEVADKKVKEGADAATKKTQDSADTASKSAKSGADSADQKVKDGVDEASSAAPKAKSKPTSDGPDRKDLDESDDDAEDPAAYEATIDDVKSKEEDQAEAELQPQGEGA